MTTDAEALLAAASRDLDAPDAAARLDAAVDALRAALAEQPADGPDELRLARSLSVALMARAARFGADPADLGEARRQLDRVIAHPLADEPTRMGSHVVAGQLIAMGIFPPDLMAFYGGNVGAIASGAAPMAAILNQAVAMATGPDPGRLADVETALAHLETARGSAATPAELAPMAGALAGNLHMIRLILQPGAADQSAALGFLRDAASGPVLPGLPGQLGSDLQAMLGGLAALLEVDQGLSTPTPPTKAPPPARGHAGRGYGARGRRAG